MEWLQLHWPIVLLMAATLSNAINAFTKHYSEHKGLVRALLFLTELLSVLPSVDSARSWKLPLTRSKK